MYEFRNQPMPDAAGDPLERLVEAFVDQSVPLGPDAATQRRLIAAMRAADSSLTLDARLPSDAMRSNAPRARRLFKSATQQFLGLAAAILIVIGAAFALRSHNSTVADLTESGGDTAIVQIVPDATVPTVAPSVAVDPRVQEVAKLIDQYVRLHDGQLLDQEAAKEFLAKLFREHPEFANNRTWQFAQDRLAYALEQPKVITVGVGLLGAIPWKTFSRF
jgi:hypothetical protein